RPASDKTEASHKNSNNIVIIDDDDDDSISKSHGTGDQGQNMRDGKRRNKWWKSTSSPVAKNADDRKGIKNNTNNSSTGIMSKTTGQGKLGSNNAKTLLDGKLKTEETETDESSDVKVVSNYCPSDDEDNSSSSSMSSSSSSSLLPMHSFSFSDDDEEQDDSKNSNTNTQALNAEVKGIRRLERKLELRRQRLQRLCEGRRSPTYTRLLQATTAAADAMELASYRERHDTIVEEETSNDNDDQSDDDNCTKTTSISVKTATHTDNEPVPKSDVCSSHSATETSTKIARPPSSTTSMSLWWILLFEINHTLPAVGIVLVVLMGHVAFYGGLEALSRSIYYSGIDQYFSLNQFFGCMVILGLALLRLNGTLYYWLDQNDFALVRLELQNRLTLGTIDAKFMKRIKGTVLCSAMNMFGYYISSVGLNHFYYNGSLAVLKPFEDWYMEAFRAMGGAFSAETGLAEPPACHTIVDWVAPSGEYSQKLFHYFCADETQEWRAITLVYHGLWFVAAAGLARFVGQNVMEYCN
ncbi:MAG: hypothetical protein SGILL_010677, partial [Bacillariaceae sp.]